MDLSSLFSHCGAYTAARSTVDLLPPKQAAVYAFYDLLQFSDASLADDIQRFKTKHARKMTFREDEFPERINIQLRGNSIPFKGEGRRLCKALDPTGLKDVSRYLAFLSMLNEPLYVGKTDDVKKRFAAHHDSGFIYKMSDRKQRSADEFLFFVFSCDKKYVRTIESILIQLINPPHCDQKT